MDKNLFIKNRNKIMEQMTENSIFIVFSRKMMDDDIAKQTYNVNRNFFYITGILDFEDIVILKNIKGGKMAMAVEWTT